MAPGGTKRKHKMKYRKVMVGAFGSVVSTVSVQFIKVKEHKMTGAGAS
jgi:hypothetical protein